MDCLATKLLRRGDAVSIERGQLVIQPASGKPVPPDWVAANTARLCREVLVAVGMDAFEYIGYSTGHYGKSRSAGVTLQFVSVLSGQSVYAVFNADLTRQRTTAAGKAGALLPKGQFRIGKRSHFHRFWLSTGLQMPDRLQRFYKCMGKLSSILLAGDVIQDRFDVQSLHPVTLSADQLRLAILGHNEGTIWAQAGHKEGTTSGHKETSTAQAPCGLQPNQTTGVANHGNKVIRMCGNKGLSNTPQETNRAPQDQSVDEWLADYSS
ncbi:hypothetical protein [Pseudomonas putida]|uniref:hypothetical protein n=1 Tax=Pseudomonas putida TaxID=303 RepID=UPI001628C7F2|nr:hypothetical protein [Pseudomonas putida]QNG07210.1 hypothetical protein GPM17_01040 [Pseudomonas putida]HDS1059581.1 hypothetical protein [Pseudomonas putida]